MLRDGGNKPSVRGKVFGEKFLGCGGRVLLRPKRSGLVLGKGAAIGVSSMGAVVADSGEVRNGALAYRCGGSMTSHFEQG